MAFASDRGFSGNDSPIVRLVGRVIPISGELAGRRFVSVVDGRRVLTPLAMALVVIELSDVVFAVDSVPAAFAITRVAWVVYAANMFAVMGLRSMYTIVSGAVDRLRFLDRGLAVILLYVGVTMATHAWVEVPTLVTLGVVTGVLAVTALLLDIMAGPPLEPPAVSGGGNAAAARRCRAGGARASRAWRRSCRRDSPFELPRPFACPDRATVF